MYTLEFCIPKYEKGEERKYKTGTIRSLILECGGVCPHCEKNKFNISNEDRERNDYEKLNHQIAHIFGLKNFDKVWKKGRKFHIKGLEEINSYKNLLLLCSDCHTWYDNPPTYTKYKQMVRLKSKLANMLDTKDYVFFQLQVITDYIEDLNAIANDVEIGDYTNIVEFNEKLEKNNINKIKKRDLQTKLIDYNEYIEEFFKNESYLGIAVIGSLALIYQKYRSNIELDANHIIDFMRRDVENILKIDGSVVIALITYAIQKCEVLEK